MAAHHNLESILQTGIGESGQFIRGGLKIVQFKDVAKSNGHLLGAKIFSEPQALAGIVAAMIQFEEDASGVFAAMQLTGQLDFIN